MFDKNQCDAFLKDLRELRDSTTLVVSYDFCKENKRDVEKTMVHKYSLCDGGVGIRFVFMGDDGIEEWNKIVKEGRKLIQELEAIEKHEKSIPDTFEYIRRNIV